ncbi:sensor histidine kinase [Agromyces atrinae]|nr:sensor histidine kinase [Agromyces atrinae]
MIRGWSIAAKLFALQLIVIVGLATVAVVAIWTDARADVERNAAARSLAVAQTIALDPFVVDAVGESDPTALLQPYAVAVMDDTGIDFITIMTPDRTRLTHRDPDEIGKKFLGTIDRALAGESFTETYTGTLGPSVRAVVPVEDDGEVVALVSAGVTVSNTEVALGARIATVVIAALAMVGVGALAAWLLSRYLRRVTWGRGADEMSRMFAYYEGVLHSIGEGIVLQNPANDVVLYNDRAAELLGLPKRREPDPSPLATLVVPEAMRPVLARHESVVEEIVITETHVLVVDRDVVVTRDRAQKRSRVGTVTTLRDHTELLAVTGELQTMTTLSDALRSQTHEFANRLHTIVALIELGRPDEAARLASSELELSQRLADRLLSAVEEPVLLALLLGKSAQASERGIELDVELPDWLPATEIPPRDLITIVGNLIDNALDAAAATPEPRVAVAVDVDGAALTIAVSDSGAGPADPTVIFAFGTTSKSDAGHGIGLALVRQSVARLGGTVDVRGSLFEVVLPLPALVASAPEADG